ncbi:pyridoxal phosphate-dependent transferase [Zopfochytrium polystomum]|nr:pyridoxal phosphate-dependent transferase [Zopfochytrium polystomum]
MATPTRNHGGGGEYALPLGESIPPDTPHAVSVSLPLWEHNIAYEEGDPNVHALLKSGYPRFVYHHAVKQRASTLPSPASRDPITSGRSLSSVPPLDAVPPQPHAKAAEHRSPQPITRARACPPRRACPPACACAAARSSPTRPPPPPRLRPPPLDVLHAVVFPSHANGPALAKQYWQHTGAIVSSRFAEHALELLLPGRRTVGYEGAAAAAAKRKRRGRGGVVKGGPGKEHDAERDEKDAEARAGREAAQFVEERFGRNWDVRRAEEAKLALRRRVAGVMGDAGRRAVAAAAAVGGLYGGDEGDVEDDGDALMYDADGDGNNINAVSAKGPCRGVDQLNESHVYLTSCGMAAIYNAFRVVRALRPGLKTVQFGFPYLDTLKIQEKFGSGCHFLGHGDERDLAQLENEILSTQRIAAVFCEFPSNPLLRSPDLSRLRALADAHGFLLVVDETVGNFVNVSVLPHADIVVSSLTKVFSGDCNVMGGCLVANPASLWYAGVAEALDRGTVATTDGDGDPQTVPPSSGRATAAGSDPRWEDLMYGEDAVFLERNSRSFVRRIERINRNAAALARFLHAHPRVESVHYPLFTTPDAAAAASSESEMEAESTAAVPVDRHGGLLSVTLRGGEAAAARFYDRLAVYKGPSLGTSFTLASPYALLAHYGELEWAARYGVQRGLVRISVGMEEDVDALVERFRRALDDSGNDC